ncbi:disulfide oxidoreductase [Candidatus Micrarchaeota archaeon RBG_16_36_9]|nr:MAG: disulfide oxidoreductase [Candidatus Micrarchaeota archaeon RBG_16_36_9]
MEKITKEMILEKVITKYPKTVEVFFKNGLPCATCQLVSGETVEQAAESHGIKLEKLLKDLNSSIKKK